MLEIESVNSSELVLIGQKSLWFILDWSVREKGNKKSGLVMVLAFP